MSQSGDELSDIKMEWADNLGLLAVGGSVQPFDACQSLFVNMVLFYTTAGTLLLRINIPDTVSTALPISLTSNVKELFQNMNIGVQNFLSIV